MPISELAAQVRRDRLTGRQLAQRHSKRIGSMAGECYGMQRLILEMVFCSAKGTFALTYIILNSKSVTTSITTSSLANWPNSWEYLRAVAGFILLPAYFRWTGIVCQFYVVRELVLSLTHCISTLTSNALLNLLQSIWIKFVNMCVVGFISSPSEMIVWLYSKYWQLTQGTE